MFGGGCCLPSKEEIAMEEDPQRVLEDLKRRIRTQNLRVEQLKTLVFEHKQRAKRCVEEEDLVGARGWLVKSKRCSHTHEVAWSRLHTNTHLLETLENAIANLDQARTMSSVAGQIDEVLLKMPPDLTELMERIASAKEEVEVLSFEPRSVDIEEELRDIQSVMALQQLPVPPSSQTVMRNTIHAEREKLLPQ